MAHFAKLDENNIVTEVIVVKNEVLNNLEFPESEPLGIEFCRTLYGDETRWVQTSYNASFRLNYAGIGCYYDEENDSFVWPVKPEEQWSIQ